MKFKRKLYMTHAAQWYGFKYGPHDLDIVPLGYKKPGIGWLASKKGKGGHVVDPGDWILIASTGEKIPWSSVLFKDYFVPAGTGDRRQFKTKSGTIEAVQWHGFEYGPHDLGIMPLNPKKLNTGYITSKRSRVRYAVNPGDWIVTYEDGEKWPYKPHDFKIWYTPAGPVKKETHGSSILADSIKALSLAENGEFKEALEYIDKVIKVCPWDQAFYQKGNIYEMMEEYDEAIKFYDKAVGMTPGFDWPMKRKAAVLRKTGRYQELKEFYNKCVDERPKIRQRAREREAKERELGYDTQYATEEYEMEKYEEILETIRKYIPKTQGENIIHPGFLNYSESGRKNVIHLGFRDYSEIAEKTYRKSPEQQRMRKDMFLKMGVILGICSAQLLAIFLYMTSSPAGTSAAVYITIGVVWSLWKLWKI